MDKKGVRFSAPCNRSHTKAGSLPRVRLATFLPLALQFGLMESLLQALPMAIEVLNLYSEAEREGYDTVTRSAHATVARVQVRTRHQIAGKECSGKFSKSSVIRTGRSR